MEHRIATIEDLPEIVRIYNTTIQSHVVTADLEEVSAEDRINWFIQHDPINRPLWVFEHESHGAMVGWLSFQAFYGRKAYDKTVEVSIYLDPETRGRGYGAQILQFAIDVAPSYKIETMLGFIFAHNEPSIKLFERKGFQQWGNLPDIAELEGAKESLLIFGLKV
ncbi:MAG: N-acetyltransferase [Pseudopedobacter saltans]|uniref:N-acetyltransferase n=1 Tax=Pseudopedobacter saltans TaxID=151895 RepID=A0A2W5HBR3_9SPHI|nr:MAG: N-acetyltransferase [Pseudopedobacter saltans]